MALAYMHVHERVSECVCEKARETWRRPSSGLSVYNCRSYCSHYNNHEDHNSNRNHSSC